jgi:hypothetical protein
MICIFADYRAFFDWRQILNNIDEWGALAEFLSNMIVKYSDVLEIDSMPDPDINKISTDKNTMMSKISNNSIATKETA